MLSGESCGRAESRDRLRSQVAITGCDHRPGGSSCCVLALAPSVGCLSDTSSLDRPRDISTPSKCRLSALSGPKVSCTRHQCLSASGSAGERGAVWARGLLLRDPERLSGRGVEGWGLVGGVAPPRPAPCCYRSRPKLTLTTRRKVKNCSAERYRHRAQCHVKGLCVNSSWDSFTFLGD